MKNWIRLALAIGRTGWRHRWITGCFLLACGTVLGGDWPQYRGANHDGISSDRIKAQWDAGGPQEVWRVACTNGLSSLAVSGGRAFTLIRRSIGGSDKEVCVALNSRNGSEVWAAEIGVADYDGSVGSDDGPRSTPSYREGRVYVLSSYLTLHCLNATNGVSIWKKDLRALYGGSLIGWQAAASPVIENDLVFVNCNTASQSLFAFRAADGSLAWRSQNAPMTHSTPVTANIGGVPQVLFAAQNGLVSLNQTNGALLWKASYPFRYDTSIGASPVVYSNIVFMSANYSMGSFATQILLSNTTFLPQ
ncbi:MAG TPA: PQQ-binding-like beta-propeller repeat protein, partial [Clostridia bacterium]|nr:PQQ-binding-like beta-propeller repeat protein [Clostridia bacterium]